MSDKKGMSNEQFLNVIRTYRRVFEELHIGKAQMPFDKIVMDSKIILPHCHAMLDEMEEFVKDGRREKAFTFLGFIQSSLVWAGYNSLNELRDHNRPVPESKIKKTMHQADLIDVGKCKCLKENECDCQNPESKNGVGHYSNECPTHNLYPLPNPECPVHGRYRRA